MNLERFLIHEHFCYMQVLSVATQRTQKTSQKRLIYMEFCMNVGIGIYTIRVY